MITFSSRLSHRHSHRNLHLGNMESSSVDLLANVDHLPRLQLQAHLQKSDSSNYNSVEASSKSTVEKYSNKLSAGDRGRGRGDIEDRPCEKFFDNSISIRFDVKKLHGKSLRTVTPFTRSLLGLISIFTKGKT
ncbi:PREDICTED: uncharacterized protein LOC108554431 [Eufriesea mexicana]|uniref:uncharacterized protein LOC108554431 n=1 Tax=Eufriesea mexicana TaxID=516756 RepID=UPI00083BD2E0|nr:PREDICTED: uncharacterized protein LOC108554431 [Eufriesea mexicana]